MERKHQHILCVERALRLHSNVPLMYWGVCILTVVHIINRLHTLIYYYRLHTLILNDKSHYKLLYIQIPSYSRLKVFNCLCFASTIAHNGFKFDPKAKQCVFLGYSFPVKGYKLLDLSTNTCFISRDDSIYVLPMSYEFLNSMK